MLPLAKPRRIPAIALCVLAAIALVALAAAQTHHPLFQPAGQLTADDGSVRNDFGYAIDTDGQTAVIGASRWNDYQGAAYVYTRDGGAWSQRARLLLPDGQIRDGFGGAVDIEGDTLAVGIFAKNRPAPNFAIDVGAVAVYSGAADAWTLQATLMPEDLAPSNRFGTALALHGDTLIAGAPNVDTYANEAAYVYRRQGAAWTLEGKLQSPGGGADFGQAVALHGDVALVCAGSSYTSPRISPTLVFIFTRAGTSWTPAGQLAPDGGQGDTYGCALAYDGQTAVVATHSGGERPGTAVRAYVFSRNGTAWSQTAALEPPSVDPHDYWTIRAAAIDGGRIYLGAVSYDGPGAVYIYDHDGQTWDLTQTLLPTTPEAHGFGHSLAPWSDGAAPATLLVGAPDSPPPPDEVEGVVHVYEPAPGGAYKAYLPMAVD